MTTWQKWALGIGAVILAALLLRPSRVYAGRLLVVGDSLTGSPGYCATLRTSGGFAVTCLSLENQGVSAIRKSAVDTVSKDASLDAVVMLAGVNDLASGRGADYVCDELDKAYRGLAARGLRVVGVLLTPWATHAKGKSLQAETAQVNDFIRRHPVLSAVVDTSTVTGQRTDGLHLTEQGGTQLALAVLEVLRRKTT